MIQQPMSSVKKLTTKEIYQINQEREVPGNFGLTKVLLHNIRSMHNVGAVFRSADAFGIGEVILTGYTPTPPRPEISKTALGAETHVPWSHYEEAEIIINRLKNDNYHIIGIEQTNKSRSLVKYNIDKSHPIVIVLGNEVTGIDNEIIPLMDEFIEIPQFGEKHSLNVSVTAGIVMYGLLEKFTQEE